MDIHFCSYGREQFAIERYRRCASYYHGNENKSLPTYHFSTALITDAGHRIKLGGITEGRFNPSNGSGGKCSGRADEGSDDSGLHGGQGVDKRVAWGKARGGVRA